MPVEPTFRPNHLRYFEQVVVIINTELQTCAIRFAARLNAQRFNSDSIAICRLVSSAPEYPAPRTCASRRKDLLNIEDLVRTAGHTHDVNAP
jgi:hypothetical protein